MSRFSDAQIDAVKGQVGLVDLIGRYVPLKKSGGEHSGLCPFHREKTPSFTINEGKGFYHCFGCGAHGDVIGFFQEIENLDFVSAVERLLDEQGLRDMPDAAAARRKQSLEARRYERELDRTRENTRHARNLWKGAKVIIPGSPADVYLRARGLDPEKLPGGDWPVTLRYYDRQTYRHQGDPADGSEWPMMIGAIQRRVPGPCRDPIVAVHRTYLNGTKKAPVGHPKKMLGPMSKGAIRFGPVSERIGIAEGIETGLSVLQSCPDLTVWVAGSLGNMSGVDVPPAPEVKEIVLLMDNDMKDDAPAERMLELADTWFSWFKKIRLRKAVAPLGNDFNDVLMGDENVG